MAGACSTVYKGIATLNIAFVIATNMVSRFHSYEVHVYLLSLETYNFKESHK